MELKKREKLMNNRLSLSIVVLVTAVLLGGCVVKDISRTVGHTVKGDYYLDAEKYSEGRQSFEKAVHQDPESASANYYYGRFLLYDKNYVKAKGYLVKARDKEPDNADYQFWAGIGYAGLKDRKREEECYRNALKIDPNHLQSLVYLGHNQLEKKRYHDAFKYYQKALDIWPGSPSALYNRALILKRLGRTPEEKIGWLEYLDYYPSGHMARRAVDHLNYLGDFSYRNHRLGPRTVTLEKIYFEPFSDRLSGNSVESLNLVGGIAEKMKKGKLQILVYQKNNKKLAKARATAIRQYLIEEFPGLPLKRIGISWFDSPQSFKIKKKKMKIEESVSFFISEK
ncbi:tetratricopeptide repeat protein [Desulfopila sp. IMCC35008]|uniref:tetratricopeptide repeat protein n=1 Tax=Desulfopila sp. IMCC35008 TaxID=2653858 RepID=UPI0013D647A0|nr:tetratricopeptide repeat protein [Desulfopila sp. IMCC35008]